MGTIRSMQLDRGARIRTFRKLSRRDPDIQAKVPPHGDDANGERYTEVQTLVHRRRRKRVKRVR